MSGRIALGVLIILTLVAGPTGSRGQSAVEKGRPGKAAGSGQGLEQELFRQSVMLGVPEAELSALVRSCRDSGFTGEEVSRLLALMSRAKLQGLPHDDLLNKLREGLAKGAKPETVQRALEDKARALNKAKGIVDTLLMEGWMTRNYDFAIKVVADAMDAGASAADILCSVRDDRPCGAGIPDVRIAFEWPRAGK